MDKGGRAFHRGRMIPSSPSPLQIPLDSYRNKILGCWMGKSAGGTLGTPLEKMWGDREPFAIDFYPVIREGGLPNDDLELQLIWLIALEERGLDLTSRDLAEYWLDYIRYNPDEYGLHKTNLRLGLIPPVSGWYNNPFRECMGCPIRSEIWACIAPGLPDVAAAYAWRDAIVDHAGGESVYGEVSNAALQSAAFFVSDRDELLDISLSVIPEDCMTARTIRRAREAHARGLSWLEARNDVMEFAYHPNAQYSPINLGFQTIGWLYGEDFGDHLCKAVNCGWDTDCTGATLGATLGLIHGAHKLPENWLAPLGRTIATSEGNGGITPGPLPRTVDELTERTIAIGRQLLARHSDRVILGAPAVAPVPGQARAMVDLSRVKELLARRQDGNTFSLSSIEVTIAYPDMPVIGVDRTPLIEVELRSRASVLLSGDCIIEMPAGLSVSGEVESEFSLEPGHMHRFAFTVLGRDPSCIINTNTGWLKIRLDRRPVSEALPIVLVGARRWLVSELHAGRTLEEFKEPSPAPKSVPGGWAEMNFPDNELVVEPIFGGQAGVVLLQHWMRSPEDCEARIGVPTDGRMKFWVDGVARHTTTRRVPLRPSLGGDEANYADVALSSGWHHVVVALERDAAPIRAHFTVAYDAALRHGMDQLEQTRFPWEC